MNRQQADLAADLVVRTARPGDLPSALRLLESVGLPTEGVAQSFEHFVVAEDGGTVIGIAGLEVYAGAGLLRSVAVEPEHRGKGLGGALTEAILSRARMLRLDEVYLLTETAADFYLRYGFRRIDRADTAPAVRASAEFTELCASSAVAMVRRISDAT